MSEMTNYIPSVISRPIASGTDLIRGVLGSVSWTPALSISRTAVTALFSRIENGTLVVIDETNGTTLSYGQRIAKQIYRESHGVNVTGRNTRAGRVILTVRKESFWIRLFLFADMGFAEAYMLQEVECDNLTGFFEVFAIPREHWILTD